MKFYRFVFADGYSCICRGMSDIELSVERAKHGNIVAVRVEGVY